jgi:hypothetical protein
VYLLNEGSMRRRAAILSADLITSVMVVAWYVWGPWVHLYGFSVYHSRGDVWLPTPPAAINFFSHMVLTVTSIYVSLFVLTSCLTFFFSRPYSVDHAGRRHFPRDAFYGDGRRLLVKYCAFLLGSIALAFATSSTLKFRASHEFSISTAVGIMLAAFLVVVFVADMLLARPMTRQKRPPKSDVSVVLNS